MKDQGRRIAVGLALCAATIFSGISLEACATSCTEVGYPNGLVVRFESADGGLPDPGCYRVTALADGEQYTFAVAVSDAHDAGVAQDAGVDDCAEEPTSPPGARFRLVDSQLFFQGPSVNFVSDVGRGPKSLRLEVKRDGEIVATEAFSPSYDRDEPNGEGCGEQFLATVAVPLPGQ